MGGSWRSHRTIVERHRLGEVLVNADVRALSGDHDPSAEHDGELGRFTPLICAASRDAEHLAHFGSVKVKSGHGSSWCWVTGEKRTPHPAPVTKGRCRTVMPSLRFASTNRGGVRITLKLQRAQLPSTLAMVSATEGVTTDHRMGCRPHGRRGVGVAEVRRFRRSCRARRRWSCPCGGHGVRLGIDAG